MYKIALAFAAVVIVLVGVYWFISGNAASNTDLYQEASTTNFYSTTTQQTSTSTIDTSVSSSTASTTINNPQKIMQATLHTSMGDITIDFSSEAPKTVANFVKLAQSGYYDGVKFHRVIQGFMDQAGDPLTKDDSKMAQWGTGGPGYTIADEFGTTHPNVAGSVAMANTGQPNSGGSQFFINAVDNHFLDGKYT